MQIPLRRAGAASSTIGRIVVLTIAAAVLVAAAILPVIGIVGVAARDTANTFNTLSVGTLGSPPTRSVMYAADGKVMTYLYPNHIYRVPVTYGQIAPVMRNAIVAIEDDTFYTEGALDPRGTIRALVHNGSGGNLQGASTLAQQYVKNVKVLQAQTLAQQQEATYPDLQRKVQQLRLAANVEHEMSPDTLLANYLNVAYFNEDSYGIEVAAEHYFSVHASQLTLPEAALLAGIVQSPTDYDPRKQVAAATTRRNEVLTRMWQLHYVSKADALAAEASPIKLKLSEATPSGCTAPGVAREAFFCDYVQHVLEINYPQIWSEINITGGIAIHTTLSMQDQHAADSAVDYVEPANTRSPFNPGNNADTEVLVQPGTGAIKAIAINRPYASGRDNTTIDYAVNGGTNGYGGGAGVQTGSSSKVFTLITALDEGWKFGQTIKIKNPDTVGPFADCHGVGVAPFQFRNAEQAFKGSQIWQLGEATVQSVNTFFANLEQQVGLCNVVKTAVRMGMTRADGRSLLKPDASLGRENGISADNVSSFTLGAVYVSPMSMALAYASIAARGVYCGPQAISSLVVIASGKQLAVKSAGCHRDMSAGVADAASYILQNVLLSPGTAAGRGIPGRHDAAKTGTANGGYYAAFAGYTPTLAGYVSVFNPLNPTGAGAMVGDRSCYHDLGQIYPSCTGQMFGDNAPGATWEMTFLHAALGPNLNFVAPPAFFFADGPGFGGPKIVGVPKPKKPVKGTGGGPGGGPTPPPHTPAH